MRNPEPRPSASVPAGNNICANAAIEPLMPTTKIAKIPMMIAEILTLHVPFQRHLATRISGP
ncbi:MAG: hypothetical protein IPG58_07125 [Acidobacteria bacterium]|nr:hypothetical protein [Acidobacteriota bacterium]